MSGADGGAGDPIWTLWVPKGHGDVNRGRMESEPQTSGAVMEARRVELKGEIHGSGCLMNLLLNCIYFHVRIIGISMTCGLPNCEESTVSEVGRRGSSGGT